MDLSYVAYDKKSQGHSDAIKAFVTEAYKQLMDLRPTRTRVLAIMKLEEAYMWCGKAIRDDQLAREDSYACDEKM